MQDLPDLRKVSDIRMWDDAHLEAWLYHFLTENNLEHLLNPSIVASPEQLQFMVALQEGQVYIPSSDEAFLQIYRKNKKAVAQEYAKSWHFIVSLVQKYNMDKNEQHRILSLCRYRFMAYLREGMILPSRLIKRLVLIVLTRRNDRDPYFSKKVQRNFRASQSLQMEAVNKVLQQVDSSVFDAPELLKVRWNLDIAELSRLMVLSTYKPLWTEQPSTETLASEIKMYEKECENIRIVFGDETADRKKILFIPDVAGGLMYDLHLARSLLRLGHQIIFAVKDGFYFNSPNLVDFERDPLLQRSAQDAYILSDASVTKNQLLQLLREYRFVIISDGTVEQLNLYRVSTSFARAWKECDIVIAKGKRNKEVLLDSSIQFTRDCLCYWREHDGKFRLAVKPRAPWTHKFAEMDILAKAKEIVQTMQQAKAEGKTIMFYSAIIGSIPGQTKTALEVVNTFVAHLRDRLDRVFIINPAEHFEEGMDGDDLMYMWEYVQRSGLLDIWRFQTVGDIEESFALMHQKVPSIWSGKDATFSTGCTKEMHIAIDVQKTHPEMQIIGPSASRFFRRQSYGVGKYFDEALTSRR